MKANILTFFFLFLVSLFFTTCKKVEKVMSVSTGVVTNILTTSADVSGDILDLGDGVTQHGHCYATTPNTSISGPKKELGIPVGIGGFTSNLTGLEPGTKYYVKAYCSRGKTTVYGSEINFTTASAALPDLTTTAISAITKSSAASGGNISDQGGTFVIARGVCWNVATAPLITDNKTTNGTGIGIFTSTLSGLSAGTKYYVRSYATNAGGTAYGDEVNFTTTPDTPVPPTVTTADVTSVTSSSAICGGNVTNEGSASVTARGACWNSSGNPTILNNKTINGNGLGSYISNLSGLLPGTTYYVKAYATNSGGTAYGNEFNFTTNAVVPTLTTVPITGITSSTAVSGGDITNPGGATILARGVCWSQSTNPTIANSLTNDPLGSSTYSSTLSGLNPGKTYYVRAYATNSAGTGYGNQLSFPTLLCPSSITVTHTAGNVAPVTKTVTYGIVESNLSGQNKCWITRNLGADKVAGSATESTETAAGWYWQFNYTQGYKHDGTTRTPAVPWYTDITGTTDWSSSKDPCTILLGTSWRIPTQTEWTNADNNGSWNSYNNTFASVLLLHAAGYIYYADGALNSRGTVGYYWSSSQASTTNGWGLFFQSSFCITGSGNSKSNGFSIRCIRD